MRITPIDIHQKEFRRSLRGYNEEEVDTFLDEVARELEKLFQENIDLNEKVEKLERKVEHYQNFEDALKETMQSAQKSSEELRNNAENAAKLIIREAQLKADQIRRKAEIEHDKTKAEIVKLKKIAAEFKSKFAEFLEEQNKRTEQIEIMVSELPSFGRFEERVLESMETDKEKQIEDTSPSITVIEQDEEEEESDYIEKEEE